MGICLSTSSSAAGSNDRLDKGDAPRGCPSVAPLTTIVGRTPLGASAFVSVVTTSTPHATTITASPSSPEEEEEEPDATPLISPTSKPQPMTMALFSADDTNVAIQQRQQRDASYSSLRKALRQQQQQFGLSSTVTSQTRSPPVCQGNSSNTSQHRHQPLQLSQHSLLLGDGEGSSFCFQESVMLELPSPSPHHQVHFSDSVIVLDSTDDDDDDDDDKYENSNSSIGKLASLRNFDCPPHKSQLATPRRHQHLLKYQDQQQQQLSTATSASVAVPLSNGLSLVFPSAEVMPRLVHHRE